MHDCPCCGAPVYGPVEVSGRVTILSLCDHCDPEGVDCGPEAWHCRCGCACDGSACPGPPQERLSGRRYAEFDELLQANGVIE